jgi:hypothetical protein
MNPTIAACMTGMSTLGYTDEEICIVVKNLAKCELSSRYHHLRNEIERAMETMTIDDLKAILAEMEKGGKQ